jgi:hypothetical protein
VDAKISFPNCPEFIHANPRNPYQNVSAMTTALRRAAGSLLNCGQGLELDPVGVWVGVVPSGDGREQRDGFAVAVGKSQFVGFSVAGGGLVGDAVVRFHVHNEEGIVDGVFGFVNQAPGQGGLPDLAFRPVKDVGERAVVFGRVKSGAAGRIAIAAPGEP